MNKSMTPRMQKLLASLAFINPNDIAEEIANGTFKVPTDEHGVDTTDELAARLACWVAVEGHEYIELSDEDDEDLIALLANLAATAMLIQHRADLRVALGIGTPADWRR